MDSEFSFTGDDFTVTQDMKKSFNEHGYIIIRYKYSLQPVTIIVSVVNYCRSLLNTGELTKLKESLETDGGIMQHSYERSDGHGRNSRLCIWSHPGEDVTGMLGRSEKVVTTTEEVCLCGGKKSNPPTST